MRDSGSTGRIATTVELIESSQFTRDGIHDVQAIQSLLEHDYRDDAGDGRTLMRELVQNADDARASRLLFLVLESGWADATNSLLRGPALVVLNNGPFPLSDRDAIRRAIGGSKGEDVGKIGRFGLGLKSVFHLCEAFAFYGVHQNTERPGVLNPWAGTGKAGSGDPVYPDWDSLGDDGLVRLRTLAGQLDMPSSDGLLLWLPLRQAAQLLRSETGTYGLGSKIHGAADVAGWFEQTEALALLLGQCGHLVSIEARRSVSPDEITGGTTLATLARAEAGWLGRPTADELQSVRGFRGEILDGKRSWEVRGVEAVGNSALRRLRERDDWPVEIVWDDGRNRRVPRKALAHAAVTVLRTDVRDGELRCRWAVFLPLEDHPSPKNGQLVRVEPLDKSEFRWEVLLHGYFWPSKNRRSIPGVTETDAHAQKSAVPLSWNGTLRDQLLLPLLPTVMETALADVSQLEGQMFVSALTRVLADWDQSGQSTATHCLVPVIHADRARWRCLTVGGTRLLAMPRWSGAPENVRTRFLDTAGESSDAVFFDDSLARLGGQDSEWPDEWVAKLLETVDMPLLTDVATIDWLAAALRCIVGSSPELRADEAPPEGIHARAAVVGRWLARCVLEGAWESLTRGEGRSDVDRRRTAWGGLLQVFPSAWRVLVPFESLMAVEELARDEKWGVGLVPSFESSPEDKWAGLVDPVVLDEALTTLGKWLSEPAGGGAELRRPRLLLAEALLGARDPSMPWDTLSELPLVRARRLPGERDDAWSMADIERERKRHRVFLGRRVTETRLDFPRSQRAATDFKSALTDLAKALGDWVWLLDDRIVATIEVPDATDEALALAVLASPSIASSVEDRAALLRRFDASWEMSQSVREAVRTLLIGAPGCPPGDLYYVRQEDPARERHEESLRLLLELLGIPALAVDDILIQPRPQKLRTALSARMVEPSVLQSLAKRLLDEGVVWEPLTDVQRRHLLRELRGLGKTAEELWRSLPLHRRLDGGLAAIDARTRLRVDGVSVPPGFHREIVVLEPDEELGDLYRDVTRLDQEELLRFMLQVERPHRHFDAIRGLVPSDDHELNRLSGEVRALLSGAAWLPSHDGDAGVAPEKVLWLDGELATLVRPLVAGSALGLYVLPDSIESTALGTARRVRALDGSDNLATVLRRLASAIRPRELSRIEDGAYVLLPNAADMSQELVRYSHTLSLLPGLRGWRLMREAARAMERLSPPREWPSASQTEALAVLARALCSDSGADSRVAALQALSEQQPRLGTPARSLFNLLLRTWQNPNELVETVLPHLSLPARDEHWYPPQNFARSSTGLAVHHLVEVDVRKSLSLAERRAPRRVFGDADSLGSAPASRLDGYFQAWRGRVAQGPIGAFLALLGDGGHRGIRELAQRWLGDGLNIDGLREELNEGRTSKGVGPDSLTTHVFAHAAHLRQKEVENLLGDMVLMDLEKEPSHLFAESPRRALSSTATNVFWEVTLRDISPEGRTHPELLRILGATVEWWCTHVLDVPEAQARKWWSRWGEGSQAQIAPVRQSILAHLPLTLQQLDVRDRPGLASALKKAQDAQRRREQAPARGVQEALEEEKRSLAVLSACIEQQDGRDFLWERVQVLMERYGYQTSGVLFELAQNADDALSQAAEIAAQDLPDAVRELSVHVSDHDGQPTVEVCHYGRPINDTGGAGVVDGLSQGWDQDLYYMMLLNLSGKRGEEPGHADPSATTGRFGLGFKSVHLVSKTPLVTSGYLSFEIIGALLPEERPLPADDQPKVIAGHLPTRVRLPLRSEKTGIVLKDLFGRFGPASALIPAFSRQVTTIHITGSSELGEVPVGRRSFRACSVKEAPGWALSQEEVFIGLDSWRLLRYRPSDAGELTGTTALVIGLSAGAVRPLPPAIPFLWNVTPTEEEWGCGYAVNGPFKLDPGRTHVSLNEKNTNLVGDQLGEALSKALVALHDAWVNGAAHEHGLGQLDADRLVDGLWDVLSCGFDGTNSPQRGLLGRIHGGRHGLSEWIRFRPVVPSKLPLPFRQRMPELDGIRQLEVAGSGLGDPKLCLHLAQVEGARELLADRLVISEDVKKRLEHFWRGEWSTVSPAGLLRDLVRDQWKEELTPHRLHSLRALADVAVWTQFGTGDMTPTWYGGLSARPRAGRELVPLRALLVNPDFQCQSPPDGLVEEQRRARMAPIDSVLPSEFLTCREDLIVFQRLRGSYHAGSKVIFGWFHRATFDPVLGLQYLLEGELRNELCVLLSVRKDRPHWLDEINEVQRLLHDLPGQQAASHAGLLATLFPEAFYRASPVSEQTTPTASPQIFFQRLAEWWGDPSIRRAELAKYEEATWPAWLLAAGLKESLEAGSDEHWLALLVLGACQSIGRTTPEQHRDFLVELHKEKAWNTFQKVQFREDWIRVLERWEDKSGHHSEFLSWRSLFPAIHLLSRFQKKYRRILLGLDRQGRDLKHMTNLLNPRVDETLTGAGAAFDAPRAPLDMGLHWVLRELVRLDFITNGYVRRHCWVPNEEVLRVLRRVGFEFTDPELSNLDKSRDIDNFVRQYLSDDECGLQGCYDLPLRRVGSDDALAQQLGLG